ncbi:hypothetical protein [Sphingomonas sp. ID0503]|uniref:calcium-binding protein n=1 Tax=Sphingomonas sp. ID0503 TaxID=3399691 RepID=UPI003AFB2765
MANLFFSPADALAAINLAIAAASPGDVVTLKAGTYRWNAPLRIETSGVTVQGAGEVRILSSATSIIAVGRSLARYPVTTTLAEPVRSAEPNSPHQDFIAVAGNPGRVAGKMVLLRTPSQGGERYAREALFIIDRAVPQGGITRLYLRHDVNPGIDGPEYKGIEFDFPVATQGKATPVRIFDPVRNVTVRNLSITFSRPNDPDPARRFTGRPDPRLFKGNADNASSISAQGTLNTRLENLSVTNSLSHGIQIRDSIAASGNNLRISGAYNKGGGSNGYGLYLSDAVACRFDNVRVFDTRHAVLFSSGHNEFYNRIHVADTNRDINFHGSPDRHNVVRVDRMVLDETSPWSAEEYFQQKGNDGQPRNNDRAAYDARNHVTFKYLKGGRSIDNVRADPGGATLLGGGGNDRLYGGPGNDVLDGQEGADTVFGGGGADRISTDSPADKVTPGSGRATIIRRKVEEPGR